MWQARLSTGARDAATFNFMAEYRFDYRFVGDPMSSTFTASFDSDLDANRWWDGFNSSRGEAVKEIAIRRRDDETWIAISQGVAS